MSEAQFASLERFISPRSIALIGIPADLSKFGGRVLDQYRKFASRPRLYLVNPRHARMHDMPCHPAVGALPEVPDLSVVLVSAQGVPAALGDVAAAGCRHALVFAAGFAEGGTEEGRAAQAWIRRFALRTGVRVMGPNCNGFVNFIDGVALCPGSLDAGGRKPGAVGIASHSGGLAQVNVMWQAQKMGLGVSHLIMCGNDADLDLLDFVNFLVEDSSTRVVLVLAERIADGARFFSMARRALELDKPIVLIKAGRTEAGRLAVASHTGAVTGSDAVHDAAFRQAGVIRVDDCGELLETGMMLATGRRPRTGGVAGMSISGGNVVLMSDLGAAQGLQYPPFGAATRERLAKLMPAFGAVRNPIDLTGAIFANPQLFRDVCTAIAADPEVETLVIALTHSTLADFDAVRAVASDAGKLLAVILSGTCREDPSRDASWFIDAGVPTYTQLLPCMKALHRAVTYAAFRQRALADTVPMRPADVDVAAARRLIAQGRGTMTERASKQALAVYGLPVPREQLAHSAAQACEIARGYGVSVALKIESPDVPHKTEAGAIRLGVQGDEAVTAAHEAVLAATLAYRSDARVEGVLVQQMARAGLEIFLGVSRDPVFGPIVTVGLGGVQVELLGDVVHRVAPIGNSEAHAMLAELKGRRQFEAWRATPARDVEFLADAIVRTSWFAVDCGDLLAEVDLNPLVLYEQGQGGLLVDALIVRNKEGESHGI